MTKRIEKAIDIFLDALNEGTLQHGDCTMCAVGNLVKNGLNLNKDNYNINTLLGTNRNRCINWSLLFCTNRPGKKQFQARNPEKIYEKYPFVKKQIESTDFTLEELAKIERTFEKYNDKTNSRESQIKGLEAVVKVMLKFDEQKEDVKEIFTKKAELITC